MSRASPLPTAALAADPMLQGTYQQDEGKDDSSKQLEEFERRLATGEVLHSPIRTAANPGSRPPRPGLSGAGKNKPANDHSHQPPMRPTFSKDRNTVAARRMSEEEQADKMERDEEVQEVRALGNERQSFDDSD